jgi:hypothetical protein
MAKEFEAAAAPCRAEGERVRQINGIPDAVKIAIVSGDTQSVKVTDGKDCVELSLGTCSFPAGLTPEQARQIAADLIASAKRVERERPAQEGPGK